MARYIDVDKAIEDIRSGDGTSMQKLFAECCLLAVPTTDVAPRAEVDQVKQLKHDVMRLMEENARLAKSQFPPYVRVCREDEAMDIGRQHGRKEVAREIFEEIERIIEKSKYQQATPYGTEERYNPYVIVRQVAELKKKYTEE